MNKTTLAVTLLICTFAFASCKKSSSSSPSIVGKWAFSNIAGTSVNMQDDTDGSTITYSYSSNTITATTVQTYYGTSNTYATTESVTAETWIFNSDGTYTINEVYNNGGATSTTSASTGKWDYLSSTKANDAFLFNGQTSQVLGNIASTGELYNIKSIGSTLVLTFINSYTTNTGSNNSSNITLTFTKQ